MALTAGLLSFLALDALAEALDLQARASERPPGTGLILLGVAASYLGLTFVSQRFQRGQRERSAPLEGVALATLVAIGIGLHNLGEGLAIGSSIAIGELALGTFLIIGFMVHNITEGLGIAAPIAGGERSQASRGSLRSRWLPARRRSSADGSAGSSPVISSACSSSRSLSARHFRWSSRSAVTSRVARREACAQGMSWRAISPGIVVMYVTGLLVA